MCGWNVCTQSRAANAEAEAIDARTGVAMLTSTGNFSGTFNDTGDYWRTREDLVPKDDAGDEEDLFRDLRLGSRRNDVSAVDKDFAEMAIIDELQVRRAKDAQDAMRDRSSRILQARVRGWLARKKYLAHRKQLSELLSSLKATQEIEAATVCQTIVRGWLSRTDLMRRRVEADRKREEDSKKKSKKGKKNKVLVIPEHLSRIERLLLIEEGFLTGWDMFVKGVDKTFSTVVELPRLEEAVKFWEKLKNPQDKVMQKMIEKGLQMRDKAKEKDGASAAAGGGSAPKKKKK